MTSFILYHLANSRSQRILWLLEELELQYQLEICKVDKNNIAYQNLKAIHPNPKFPLLQIQSGQTQDNIFLSETTAITEYLTQKYQKFGLDNLTDAEHIDFFYWKNFAESSFMPNLALKQIFAQIVNQTPFIAKPISILFKYGFDKGFLNHALEAQMNAIETQLSQRQWITGSIFTLADIVLWFPMRACVETNRKFKTYPNIQRYLQDLESRPAFQNALEKGQWSESTFKGYWNI